MKTPSGSSTTVATAALIASAAHALASTAAVNWGGNYVSSDLRWADDVSANRTASDNYGDPHGPFLTDADGDGADDSIAGRALDTVNPFLARPLATAARAPRFTAGAR